MAVHIALRRSREESSRPRDGSVRREALALAHRTLGSGGAGSSCSQQPEHRSFPITGPADYESYRVRATRREKKRARAIEIRLAADMAEAEAAVAKALAAAKEEAIRARIAKKRQRRNTRALAREQSQAVLAMAGLLPMKEKDSDDEDNSGDEHIRLDPYCVFERYFREKDNKDTGNGKGSCG